MRSSNTAIGDIYFNDPEHQASVRLDKSLCARIDCGHFPRKSR